MNLTIDTNKKFFEQFDQSQYCTCQRCPCCGKLVKGAFNYPQFPGQVYCGGTVEGPKVDPSKITA